MKVVFMGTPDFAVNTLSAIVEAGHEVLAVFTQPDKPKGRGKDVAMSPVKEKALELGLEVFQPVKIRTDEWVELLQKLQPEVIVVVAFGQIMPQRILDIPRYGCINIHASLLPLYRGAAPIQWAVIDGREESGVTIMQMDAGIDTGDILKVVKVKLDEKETGGSLFDRLADLGARALVDTLEELPKGTITAMPQTGEATHAARLDKTLGNMDFTKSSTELERLIRGLNPWPSAYTHIQGKTLKIWAAEILNQGTDIARESNDIACGTIHHVDKKSFYIKTGDGSLRITELQLEGKKRMDTESFLRGYTLAEGTKCE